MYAWKMWGSRPNRVPLSFEFCVNGVLEAKLSENLNKSQFFYEFEELKKSLKKCFCIKKKYSLNWKSLFSQLKEKLYKSMGRWRKGDKGRNESDAEKKSLMHKDA